MFYFGIFFNLIFLDCFKMLDLWFGYVRQVQGVLPPEPRFDYDYFFDILILLLRDDHHATVSMTLVFVLLFF